MASSGEHDSTAAVKVWRRQTPATTGFPRRIECQDERGHRGDHERTGKEMFVYPSELYVCLCRVGDHEDVDDLRADNLGEGVSKDVLNLDRASALGGEWRVGTGDIGKGSQVDV